MRPQRNMWSGGELSASLKGPRKGLSTSNRALQSVTILAQSNERTDGQFLQARIKQFVNQNLQRALPGLSGLRLRQQGQMPTL